MDTLTRKGKHTQAHTKGRKLSIHKYDIKTSINFNPNVSSLNRKYLRNIKNEYVLVMWNELEIKDRSFLMMCALFSPKVAFKIFIFHCQL